MDSGGPETPLVVPSSPAVESMQVAHASLPPPNSQSSANEQTPLLYSQEKNPCDADVMKALGGEQTEAGSLKSSKMDIDGPRSSINPMMDKSIQQASSGDDQNKKAPVCPAANSEEREVSKDGNGANPVHLQATSQLSFKDKLVGDSSRRIQLIDNNKEGLVLGEGDVKVGLEGDVPSISFSSHVHHILTESFRQTVAVRLLTGGLGYKSLR